MSKSCQLKELHTALRENIYIASGNLEFILRIELGATQMYKNNTSVEGEYCLGYHYTQSRQNNVSTLSVIKNPTVLSICHSRALKRRIREPSL